MKIMGLFIPFTLAAGLALAQAPKVSAEIQALDPKANLPIIVQFDKDPTDAYHQKVVSRGGSLRASLHSISGGAYSMPASAIADLARRFQRGPYFARS